MGGHEAELLVLDPLLKGHDIFRHVPDALDAAAALDLKGVEDVLRLGADRVLVGDVVSDDPHALPVELLGVEPHAVVEIGLVDVEIHHAGVGAADLREVRVAEAAAYLRGAAPVLDLGLRLGVSALHDAGDDRVALAGALEVGDHLAHSAAGIELTQPGGGVSVGVIGSLLLLKVHEHDGHVQIAHGGEHVVGGGVGQQLQDDEIHVGGAELVAGRGGELFGGADAAVDQLHGVGQGLLEGLVLAFKLRNKGGELGQIRAQCDGEHADSCFGFD